MENRTQGIWSKPWLMAGLALTLLLLVPIWLFQFLPLNDWPNHLASMHLLLESQAGIPTYIQPSPDWLLPNSSIFWFMRLLGPITGVENAGRLILSLTLVLSIWGTAYFAKSVDSRLEPLGIGLGAVLAFNWFFLMGFLNFALSIPLFLITAGYWMETSRKMGTSGKEGTLHAPSAILPFALAFLLTLTHLVAGLVLLALMGMMRAFELMGEWREKKKINMQFVKHCLIFDLPYVLPILLLGLLSASTLLSGESTDSKVVWGTPLHKLVYAILAMPSPVLAIVGGVVLASYMGLWLWQNKRKYRPDNAWLALALLMALGALVLPENTATWQFAAPRLWPFVYFFLCMAIFLPLVRSEKGASLARDITLALMLLAAVQALMLINDWQGMQTGVREVAGIGDKLNRGASVLPLGEGFAQNGPEPGVSPYFHAWGYWVMQKDVFVPYLFAWNYSPVKYTNPKAHAMPELGKWMEELAFNTFNDPPDKPCQYWQVYYQQFNWSLISREYDYVVMRKGLCENESMVPLPFVQSWQKDNVTLFENQNLLNKR